MTVHQVYAILAECEPPKVKFGISLNPEKRLRNMQGHCPHRLKLLASVKATRTLEKRIHNALRHQRGIGEWFDYEHEARDVADMMEYSDADRVYKHLDCLEHAMYCAALDVTPEFSEMRWI